MPSYEKTVLITGGSSGYGKAMAKLFTQEGYRVIIAARTEKNLQEAAAQCIEKDILPEKVDVAAIRKALALHKNHCIQKDPSENGSFLMVHINRCTSCGRSPVPSCWIPQNGCPHPAAPWRQNSPAG